MNDAAQAMLVEALPVAMRQLVQLAFDAKDPRVGRDACGMLLRVLLSEPAVQATTALPASTVDLHIAAVRQVQDRRAARLAAERKPVES